MSGIPSCTFAFELQRAPAGELSRGDSSAVQPKWEPKWHLESDQPGTLRVTRSFPLIYRIRSAAGEKLHHHPTAIISNGILHRDLKPAEGALGERWY